MNIGIFDSGLGGLIILKNIIEKLPQYDYIYLGDTKRLPYGNRSSETIYEFTKQAVDFLFKKDCQLIILACNTTSAESLRRIQQEYLPKYYPNRRVLGVIIPTVEELTKYPNISKVGVIATHNTVESGAYIREIHKINPKIKVYQSSAPLLVPIIEYNGLKWIKPVVRDYLKPVLAKKVDTLILGCTHYILIQDIIRDEINNIPIISQETIIAEKLGDYLRRHPEIDKKLGKNQRRKFFVTELTNHFKLLAQKLYSHNINFQFVKIDN